MRQFTQQLEYRCDGSPDCKDDSGELWKLVNCGIKIQLGQPKCVVKGKRLGARGLV